MTGTGPRIGCDTSWTQIALDADPAGQLAGSLGPQPDPIPITPRACLWLPNLDCRAGASNALVSALLGFLQLPIQQLAGVAYLSGSGDYGPVPLTPTQQQALATTLQTLIAMPQYLALHAQAGRIATGWRRTTIERESHDRAMP